MNRLSLRVHPLALIIGAYLVLGLVYSTTIPLFEAPDEQWHFAFVQNLATGRGLPVQSLDQPTSLARQEGSQPPLYYLIVAGATYWIDTSDYPGIVWANPHYGYDVPGIVNDNKNLFIHTSRENFPYKGAVLAIHVARLVSLILGAAAILFTFLLVEEILPRKRLLAITAAALVAVVPQFLLVSSAVSNDSAIVAMSALSLWLMVRMARVPASPRNSAALGAAVGLAAIAKVSGLALVVLALVVLLLVLWRKWSQLARCAAAFLGAFLVIAGWWYVRNLQLYGELTGTEMMLHIFGARQTPLTLGQFLAQLGEVWETFWIGFGWGNIRAQPIIYNLLEIVVVLAGLGLLYGLYRRRHLLPHTPARALPFAILVVWVALVFGEFLRWMLVTQAPHGRLLFPALPALATLLVAGLTEVAPANLRPFPAPSFALVLFGLAAFSPALLIAPAYAFPPDLTSGEIQAIPGRVDVTFDNKVRLLGIEVSPTQTSPGGSIQLSLFWQSLAPMDRDYSIGIHALDPGMKVIGARDSYPGHGMYPTSLWKLGEVFRDEYWVPIAVDATSPSVAKIQVGLYDRSDHTDLDSVDASGRSITPIVGRFKIAGPISPHILPENPTHYTFGNLIVLDGYTLKMDSNLDITLFWERAAPIPGDYTVFVHILDSNGKILAQQDQQPMKGANPTSLWAAHEQVVDPYLFELGPDSAQIEVGLYSAETGARLGVLDASGRAIGDHLILPLPKP